MLSYELIQVVVAKPNMPRDCTFLLDYVPEVFQSSPSTKQMKKPQNAQ